MSSITSDEAVEILTMRLFFGQLNDTQQLVLRESWQGKSYQQIADTFKYDPDYIKGVGSRLWRSLSKRLGTAVTKSNLHSVISTYLHQSQLLSTESKTLSNPLTAPYHSYSYKSKIVEQVECKKNQSEVQSYPLKSALDLSSYYGKILCRDAVDRAVTLKESPIKPPSFDHHKLIERLKLEKKRLMAQIKDQGWKVGVKSAITLSYKDFQRIECLSQTPGGIDAIALADLWQWLVVREPNLHLQFEDNNLQELISLHPDHKAIFIAGWIEGVLTVWHQVKDKVDDIGVE